jgi:hypothetical protein
MPKMRGERTTRGLNRYTGTPSQLKYSVCTITSKIIGSGGRIDIIFNYLKKVQEMSEMEGDKIPRVEELKSDLISGFKILATSKGNLIGTPILNQGEKNSIYLTSEQAKKVQIQKDEWLRRFIDSNEAGLMSWLTDDTVQRMFELPDETPITPHPRNKEEHGDRWVDISIIYNNTIGYLKNKEEKEGVTELLSKMPENLPLTHISINVGKIADYQEFIKEMGETLLKDASNLAINLTSIFTKLGLITLKVGGYTIAITTKFIIDLFLNILQNKINSRLWRIIAQGVGFFSESPFIISDDSGDIQSNINHKYKLFLCLIIIKTIFMLGSLIVKDVDSNMKITQIIKSGIELLDTYNTEDKNYDSLPFVSEDMSQVREDVEDIMISMNKLTEWYLMRKTIVFDMNSNELLLLEDRKEYRNMTREEIDVMLSSEMELEQEPEPGFGLIKKRTRRRRRSKDNSSTKGKKKKGKKRKQTKRGRKKK